MTAGAPLFPMMSPAMSSPSPRKVRCSILPMPSDRLGLRQRLDLLVGHAEQARQNLLLMLAEQWRRGVTVDRRRGEADRIADHLHRARQRMIDLDFNLAGTDLRIGEDTRIIEDRAERDIGLFERLAKVVDRPLAGDVFQQRVKDRTILDTPGMVVVAWIP